ncbi:MAG: hypothetical protein QG608_3641 [Actinomycetota bacterium]|nr:hypothetical protein [Actinomycetota bacterium]
MSTLFPWVDRYVSNTLSMGRILRQASFTDSLSALRARFAAEREYHDQPGIEVVVLNADSEDALRRTHRRYFESVEEIMRAFV